MPNESAQIIVAATHGKLTKVRDAFVVEGTVNALKVKFQFRTKDWDDTIKTAVFVRGRATPSTPNADLIHVILNDNNECNIPHEVLVPNGCFSVGVFGTAANYTIPSNWLYYNVMDGCCVCIGGTPIDATPSLYEQILVLLKNKSDIGHEHNQVYYTKLESDERYARRGDAIGSIDASVISVNNKKGEVILNAEDVGAFANITQQHETEIYNVNVKSGDTKHASLGLVEGHKYKLEVSYNPLGTPRVDTIIVTARYSESLQCVAVPNRSDDDYTASGMTDPGNDGFAIGDTVTHVHTNWFAQFMPVSAQLYAIHDIQVPTIPYDAIIEPPITQVQSDWNQNDSTAIDYIKNRPFGDEVHATDISGTTYTITGFNSSVLTVTHEPIPLSLGQVWAVRSNNESNDRILSVKESENGELYLGTLAVNDVPFCIKSTETTINASYRSQMGVSRFILTCVSGVITSTHMKQVEQKYVPNADWNQNNENGDGYIKNRTHYQEEIVENIEYQININGEHDIPLELGQTYELWYTTSYNSEWTLLTNASTGEILTCEVQADDDGLYVGDPYHSIWPACVRPTNSTVMLQFIRAYGIVSMKIVTSVTTILVKHLDSKYIKDMYYDNSTEEVIVDNLTSEEYSGGNGPRCTFVVGDIYHVIWNSTLYENLTCSDFDGWRVLGNPEVCPFYIDDDGGDALYIESAAEESYVVSIIHNIKDINKIDSKYLPDNVATTEYVDAKSVQSDWFVNDDTDSAYIKNRTHYEEYKDVVVVPATEIQNRYSILLEDVSVLKVGNQCVITIDGVEYKTTVRENVNLTIGTGVNTYDIGIGSWMYLNTSPANVGVVQRIDDCPFALVLLDDELMFAYETTNATNDFHTVEVCVQNYELHKLDAKYLPDIVINTASVQPKDVIVTLLDDGTIDIPVNDLTTAYDNGSRIVVKNQRYGQFNSVIYKDVNIMTLTNTRIVGSNKVEVDKLELTYDYRNDINTWNYTAKVIEEPSIVQTIGNSTTKLMSQKAITDLLPKYATVTIPAANWTGNTNPWSQVVTINGITANSKVDLQPSAPQIVALQDAEIALMLQNDSGTITAWAIGNKPVEDYTMQVLITEVTYV